MSKSRWVLGRDNVVHLIHCAFVPDDAAPYMNTIVDPALMLDHIAKPDFKDGHYAKSNLTACNHCVYAVAQLEQEVARGR